MAEVEVIKEVEGPILRKRDYEGKQEKCMACGKELLGRQLKYCSKACYFAGRHNRKRGITGEDIKLINKISDRK